MSQSAFNPQRGAGRTAEGGGGGGRGALGCSAWPHSRTPKGQLSDTRDLPALASPVRKSAPGASRPPSSGRWSERAASGLSRLFLPAWDASDPEPRVIHEARGRSQDGCVQEAVEGEETGPGGLHPPVSSSSAAHPPHKREYAHTLLLTGHNKPNTPNKYQHVEYFTYSTRHKRLLKRDLWYLFKHFSSYQDYLMAFFISSGIFNWTLNA